ncbi:MAG TPA: glutamate racemase [Rhodanobacter sp.]|nr:glutamate racemase [Rhodanobacter sp.]
MIGVFDSGIGGLSILQALRTELPQQDFIYIADSGYAPYGERNDAQLIARSRAITEHLRAMHDIEALVVACNTATAAAIHLLRAEHPGLPIIGVEPALKPALALSRTRRIGVMATRSTLASAKFGLLLGALASQAEFICQPCDGLADAIEHSAGAGDEIMDATDLIAHCARHTRAMGSFGMEFGQIDTLVLGCTHYPFVQAQLRELLGPQVRFVATGEPVARQTRRLLQAARQLAPSQAAAGTGRILLRTTGKPAALEAAARRWLQLQATAELLFI